jgi:hypothetical protein
MYFELRRWLLSRINRTRAAVSATLDFISSGRWSILTPAISFICSNANAENAFGLIRPPQLGVSFNRQRRGKPSPITASPLRFRSAAKIAACRLFCCFRVARA